MLRRVISFVANSGPVPSLRRLARVDRRETPGRRDTFAESATIKIRRADGFWATTGLVDRFPIGIDATGITVARFREYKRDLRTCRTGPRRSFVTRRNIGNCYRKHLYGRWALCVSANHFAVARPELNSIRAEKRHGRGARRGMWPPPRSIKLNLISFLQFRRILRSTTR